MSVLLASGRTADIYTHGNGVVLKLFRTWVPLKDIESEQRKASAAHAAGIPTPLVGAVVHQNMRIGLAFERVQGLSMMEKLVTEPDSVEPLARLMAHLHVRLHRTKAPDELPSQGEVAKLRISRCKLLAESEREALLGTLDDLQGAESFCHGDFHPGNVMLTDAGPMIIDWIDASRGDPIADVARTSLLFLGHIANECKEPDQVAAMKLFHEIYIDRYMELNPGSWSKYHRWLPVMAAARLQEGIKEQESWLLERARAGLAKH